MHEIVRQYNPWAGEWQAVTVEVSPDPARRPSRASTRRPARHGSPRDLTGLSDGSPLPAWWRDTAYAPMGPLADLRTYVKPSAMRTRRPAVVMPSGLATDTRHSSLTR
jgi:hypothetical protein